MRLLMKSMVIATAVIILSGCQNPTPELQVEQKSGNTDAYKAPRIQHMIFFTFNSEQLPDNTLEILTPHAEYLISNPSEKVLVEGYADEVGTGDFNYQLGKKRAQAVVDQLLLLGVSKTQLVMQSAGETRPLNHGNWPETDSRNRRVALYY